MPFNVEWKQESTGVLSEFHDGKMSSMRATVVKSEKISMERDGRRNGRHGQWDGVGAFSLNKPRDFSENIEDLLLVEDLSKFKICSWVALKSKIEIISEHHYAFE